MKNNVRLLSCSFLLLTAAIMPIHADTSTQPRVNVTCNHGDATQALIKYKHYNQERRNILAAYDEECMGEHKPALQKDCMKLIKAYEEIRDTIEGLSTYFVFTGFLQGENRPQFKCYDLVGKRGKSMAMWKKKAAQ